MPTTELAVFRKEQIEDRNAILRIAVTALCKQGALAVHQFGSLARGEGDELSDLDLWATFEDSDMAAVGAHRDEMYARIAPVVIKHENPHIRTMGGYFSLVIHETPAGLCEVDYHLSARSSSPVPTQAILLRGREMPRGEWILDRNSDHSPDTADHVAFNACMSFVLAKGIIRGWEPDFFSRTREAIIKLTGAELPSDYAFGTLLLMAKRLGEFAEPDLRIGVGKIRDHIARLAWLYGDTG